MEEANPRTITPALGLMTLLKLLLILTPAGLVRLNQSVSLAEDK